MSTLKLEFIEPIPAPSLGYLVKYREVGTIPYTTVTPNPTTSPILITGQPDGKNWEGKMQAQCDATTFSAEVDWAIDDTLTCKTYLVESIEDLAGATASVDFLDCSGNPDSLVLNPNESWYICARAGTLVNNNPTEVTIEETAIGCVTDTLEPTSYDVTAPAITGTCNYTTTTGVRDSAAATNSASNNVRVKMTVRFTSDGLSGSPFVDAEYTFEAGATTANENPAIDLSSGGSCSQIFINIINIEIIP